MESVTKEKVQDLTEFQEEILHILSFSHKMGANYLTKFQLIKFIYIIEHESWSLLGEGLIDKVEFKKEKNGPVLVKGIYREYEALVDNYIEITEGKTAGYGYGRHEVRLLKMPTESKLSNEKRLFINSILSEFLYYPQNELRKYVYSTKPVKDLYVDEMHMNDIEKIWFYWHNKLDMGSTPLDSDISEE